MPNAKARALEAIERLDYDFQQFTLEHFIDYLISYRSRPILLKAMPMSELHAVWVRKATIDFIAYNSDAHPTHQVHNVLHECGHLVLGHEPRPVHELLSPALLGLRPDKDATLPLQMRSLVYSDDPQEIEAEEFVRQLQNQILIADRIHQLIGRSSSIEVLARYARNLGYQD